MPKRKDKEFTAEEVAEHNKAKSLWLIIDQKVYDVTQYHKRHPGGAAVMLGLAGKDATVAAAAAHTTDLPYTVMKDLQIGTLVGPQRARRNQQDDDPKRQDEPKMPDEEENAEDSADEPIPEKKTADVSPYGAGMMSTEIEDSLILEVVEGEEALVATADLVYQRLRRDKNLMRFMNDNNLRQLASQLRSLLIGVFEEQTWPAMQVSPDLLKGAVDGLADVLADTLQMPLPLGEDPLVAAMHILNKEKRMDRRVTNFFDKVRLMVIDDYDGGSLQSQFASEASTPRASPSSDVAIESARSLPNTARSGTSARISLTGSPDQAAPPMQKRSSLVEQAPMPKQQAPMPKPRNSPRTRKSPRREAPVVTPVVLPGSQDFGEPSMLGSDDPSLDMDDPVEVEKPMADAGEPTPQQRARPEDAADGFNQDAGGEINVNSFEELRLDPVMKDAAQDAWKMFLSQANSRQAAGEAIYAALFEGAPSLQSLFTTPRAVQAMRFMIGLNSIVSGLDDPAQLKMLVETLGFGHLHLEVTIPRVALFRDAILDLFVVELQEKFSNAARDGWMTLLNYVGGAIIYIKSHYAERIAILLASWKSVNQTEKNQKMETDSNHSDDSGQSKQSKVQVVNVGNEKPKKKSKFGWITKPLWNSNEGGNGLTEYSNGNDNHNHQSSNNNMATNVPTTFPDMFRFNAAVMGFGNNSWMNEVLVVFDNIVTNVANSGRLQEECEVLSLRISKVSKGNEVHLGEFKACMLASLRSLLPKDWSTTHEVAWTWLWKNVEAMIDQNMRNPPSFEKALKALWDSMDSEQQYEMRKNIYSAFFMAAPAGQDYFKQSNTRLHFIAERILQMTLDLYQDPIKMVDDISALGLRHVGYGIPTELFGPFVTVCIEVLAGMKCSETALEAFRWSLGLIAKILVRTINEGSTFVMMAVNANSARQLKKAISSAPRGSRASWLLHVQIGTQHISPLSWAIESGSLDAAKTILQDLRTIRADREAYYCGMDQLFTHHPNIVRRLCQDAPSLLPTLLEGLVWRSRHTKNGLRRVNYYVKHLIITVDGHQSDALKALVESQDPKIISHPVIVLVSDSMWGGLVSGQFILRKIWFVLSLIVFMASQAILPNLRITGEHEMLVNWMIVAGRVVSYCFGIGRLSLSHGKTMWKEYSQGHTVKVLCFPVPMYLMERYNEASFALLIGLVLMWTHEPLLYCIDSKEKWPTEFCDRSIAIEERYQVFSMLTMAVHWLLLVDLAVFSTGLSAFVLVCGHVLSEVSRFLVALTFLLLTFGSAISSLRHEHMQFRDVGNSVLTLFAITVGRYEGDYREINDEPVLLGAIFLFVLASAVLLLNLLIAQLNCSYEFVYQDMVGFARLNRAACITETLETIPIPRWERFVATLGLDIPLEFNEGDVGMAGGISVMEPAALHPTLEDSIHRFGGSCSPEMQWPEEDRDQQEDQFERMERLLQKVMKRVVKGGKRAGGDSSMDHDEDDDMGGTTLN